MILPIILFGSALISWLIITLIRRYAGQVGLIAQSNDRSSHVEPTPSGGGLGIVLVCTLTGLYLFFVYDTAGASHIWPLSLGLLLACVGLWDDIQHVSARIRALTQIICCLGLLVVVDSLPAGYINFSPISFGLLTPALELSGVVLSILLLISGVWWINLFNFMDGIDGLAGIQALFMIIAGWGVSAWMHPEVLSSPLWLWASCIVGATSAFTVLNWPPASIFMGDVGSTWLAFIIFVLGLLSIQSGWSTYTVWLILGAVFITDTTVTLLTRILRNKRWYSAHRSHAYQQLARRWSSHRSVTLLALAINIFLLLPLVFISLLWPQWNLVWLGCAYVPLIVGTIKLGAGKND
ncbi:MAG: glycosyltransferase family 4 protein [Porticoccaceae bacterium]